MDALVNTDDDTANSMVSSSTVAMVISRDGTIEASLPSGWRITDAPTYGVKMVSMGGPRQLVFQPRPDDPRPSRADGIAKLSENTQRNNHKTTRLKILRSRKFLKRLTGFWDGVIPPRIVVSACVELVALLLSTGVIVLVPPNDVSDTDQETQDEPSATNP